MTSDEIDHPFRVAVFVVVPGDQLEKLVVQLETSLRIVTRRKGIAVEGTADGAHLHQYPPRGYIYICSSGS